MHPHSTMDAGPELDAEVDRRLFGHTGHGYYGPPTDPSVAWAHHLSVRYDAPDAADAAYRAYYEARYPTPESRHGVCAPEDLGFDLCYWQDGWGPRCTPEYSQEIAAAMTVFERMVERVGYGVIEADMEYCKGQGLVGIVCFTREDGHGATSHMGPLPEAICRAALAALDHAGAVASQ